MSKGTLYLVATPIGNLDDITVRAVEILRTVDLIACEDTRTSRVLLRRWDIATRVLSLHRFSESRRIRTILDRLHQGQNVALISDAGTPAISDPGARVVRAALEAGFPVSPIPGASAITAALSASGMDGSSFVYLGFVPKKLGLRTKFFEQLLTEPRTAVFLETPLRIKTTLKLAADILGTRRLVLLREMTKVHEETLTGSARTILEDLEKKPSVKGEITLVLEGAAPSGPEIDLEDAVRTLIAEGFSGKRLADEAHRRFGVKKGKAYSIFLRTMGLAGGKSSASKPLRKLDLA